jgi:hypothetical protein
MEGSQQVPTLHFELKQSCKNAGLARLALLIKAARRLLLDRLGRIGGYLRR